MPPRVLALLVIALLALPAAAEAAKRPDLTVAKAEVAGGVVKLTVRNAGRKAAAAGTARVWLNRKGGTALGDARVKKLKPRKAASIAIIAAGVAGRSVVASLRARAGVAPGTYAVVACADATGKAREAKERNNCRTAEGRLVVAAPQPGTPQPQPTPTATATPPGGGAPLGDDLRVTTVADPPEAVHEGAAFELTDTVAGTGANTTRYYLTPDSVQSLAERGQGAIPLRDIQMAGAREAAAPSTGTTSVGVPVGTKPGVYHLLACADDRQAVAEPDEGNNCARALDGDQPDEIVVLAEAQEYRIDALSDVFEPELELDPTICFETQTGSFATVDAAVESATAFLNANAAAGMAQFVASPEFNDPAAVEELAMGAVAAGYPGAGLAALLRAHELQPQEASHLINAAPIASAIGLPAEALAFLDGARRLDDADHAPMGLGRHGVALANRGQALMLLGRHAEADKALDAALDADPLLAEANGTRAATALCQHGPDAAEPFARKAGSRREPRAPEANSGGRESSLRNLEFPGFPEQAANEAQFWFDFNFRIGQEIMDQQALEAPVDAAINQKFGEWSPAQRRAYTGVIRHMSQALDEADVKAKRQVMNAKIDEIEASTADFWLVDYMAILHEAAEVCEGSEVEDCLDIELNNRCRPATRIAHQEWLDHTQEAYDAAKAYYRLLSRRMSGYGAHLGDVDAHKKVKFMIRTQERLIINHLIGSTLAWTQFVKQHSDHCVEPFEPAPPDPAPGPVDPSQLPPCPPELQAMNFVIDAIVVKAKLNCEEAKLETSWGAHPWIKGFGEIGYKFRDASVTMVVGAKAEASAGVLKGALKAGAYVTVDRNGLKDLGVRVGPSYSVGAGSIEMKRKHETDISFMGAVNYLRE